MNPTEYRPPAPWQDAHMIRDPDPPPARRPEPAASHPPDPPPNESLARHAVRGGAVTILGQVGRVVIQVLGVVVLSRLLNRTDYGLLAMVTVVIGVGEILRDFGLSSAAVQAKSLSHAQRSNLFWINSGIGLALGGLLFLVAPLLAMAYARPELTMIAQALSLVFLFNGLAAQHRASLARQFKFTRLVAIDIISQTLALIVAVILAWQHQGVLALICQQLTQFGSIWLLSWILSPWTPRKYQRGANMRELMTFGWHLAASQLVNYFGKNVDTVIIGLQMGAAPLGLYNRGYQLLMTPLGQFRSPLSGVAIPILSRLQDEPTRFRDYLLRAQLLMGLTIGATLGCLMGCATPLIQLALGSAFWEIDWIFRWLALAGLFQTLGYVNYWVFVACGLVKPLYHYSWAQTALRVAFVAGGILWGIYGVAAGWAVASVIEWLCSFWWLRGRGEIDVRRLILGGWMILGLALSIGAASFAGTQAWAAGPPLGRLALGVTAGAVAYTLAVALSTRLRQQLSLLLRTTRNALASRRT